MHLIEGFENCIGAGNSHFCLSSAFFGSNKRMSVMKLSGLPLHFCNLAVKGVEISIPAMASRTVPYRRDSDYAETPR